MVDILLRARGCSSSSSSSNRMLRWKRGKGKDRLTIDSHLQGNGCRSSSGPCRTVLHRCGQSSGRQRQREVMGNHLLRPGKISMGMRRGTASLCQAITRLERSSVRPCKQRAISTRLSRSLGKMCMLQGTASKCQMACQLVKISRKQENTRNHLPRPQTIGTSRATANNPSPFHSRHNMALQVVCARPSQI